MKKLGRKFFTQPTLKVACDILGKFLVHELPDGQKLSGMIVEVEVYIGEKDKASHAFGGKRTARNEAEYLTGGHVYIYLVYGMYWQFNISTSLKDKPECILIRALELANTNSVIPAEAGIQDSNTLDPRFHGDDKRRRMPKDLKTIKLNNLANGPGKLCRYMKLNKSFYGYNLCQKDAKLYIEDRGVKIRPKNILKGPRIGIDYAGPYWSKIPWRFWIRGNKCVSK